MPPEAPTATELLSHPVVQAALAAAWSDSFPESPGLRHEEGGWVHMHESTGVLTVRRSPPGICDEIDPSRPPVVPEHYVVAIFHTHPNPT